MKRTINILLGILFSITVFAQRPIEVTVQIDQPYPLLINDYIQNFERYTLNVWNHTFSSQEVVFTMAMTGNNGVRIATKPEYRSNPLALAPEEITVLAGPGIEEIFQGLDLLDVEMEGLGSSILDVNAVLPEGEYIICVEARDLATDAPLSIGCSFSFDAGFGITPNIIFPNQDIIDHQDPNYSMWITWDIDAPPHIMESDFEYNLVLKDLTNYQELDPEEVMTDPSIAFHHPEPLEGLNMSSYIYNDDGASPWEVGHYYGVQVQVVDPMGDMDIPNSGYSTVRTFWFGNDSASIHNEADSVTEVNEEEGPTQAQYDCLTNCYFDTINVERVPIGSADGLEAISIGHFTITELSNISIQGELVSGDGIIEVQWLNDLEVMVEFDNLRVNSSGRAFDGMVTAMDQSEDLYELSDIHMLLQLGEIAIPDQQLEEIHSYIQAGRIVDDLLGDEEIGVPFGFNQEIQGRQFTLAVTNIEFTPENAQFDLIHIMPLNFFGDDMWFAAGINDACLTPGGIANEYLIKQAATLEHELPNGLTVGIAGDASDDASTVRESASYFEMDCNGIKSMALRGYVKFPRTTIVPVQEDGESIMPDEQVHARFSMTLDRTVDIENNIYALLQESDQLPQEAGMHFLADITMDPFQITGVPGWTIRVDSASMDFSELENPVQMVVPSSYYYGSGTDGVIDPSWKGFYLQHCSLSVPGMLGNTDARIALTGVILDPDITLNVEAQNIVDEGNLMGWAFDVDSLGLSIVQNQLQEGFMAGNLGAPMLDAPLDYIGIIDQVEGPLDYIESTLEYSFSVLATDTVGFEMLAGKGELYQNSNFSVNYHPMDSTQSYISAYLAGMVTVNDENIPEHIRETALATFKMPEAIFELGYHSREGFTHVEFGWIEEGESTDSDLSDETIAQMGEEEESNDDDLPNNEDQGNLSGFKINIEDIDLDYTAFPEVDLVITPSITIMNEGDGFGGSTTLRLHSALNLEASGLKKIRMIAPFISLDGITLNADVAGVKMDGSLEFYNERNADNEGDKGLRGDLSVLIPGIDVAVMFAGEFGTRIADETAPLGSADHFNYWYVNGKMFLGSTGIVVPPGMVTIHGVGGMVGVNMAMAGTSTNDSQMDIGLSTEQLRSEPQKSPEEAQHGSPSPMVLPLVPQFGARRLGLTAVLAIINQEMVNMDVGLAATWQQGHGISEVTITGDCYVLTPLMDRGDPKFYASSQLTYRRPEAGQSALDGNLEMYVNFGKIRGAYPQNKVVDANFHYQNYADSLYDAGFWNLSVGTYEQPGKLEVDFGDALDIEATSYFMAGHSVPTSLPPLPESISNMLGSSNVGEEGSFEGEDLSASGDRPAHETQGYRTGNGLAFGTSLHASAEIDIDILYASLEADLGFDLNITQDPGRICLNSGESPGLNGWYGTGQAYAGLSGDLGVRFRMFGKDQDIKLLDLAAAIALQGGAPAPIWFDGRGMVYYSVLGGLVEGDVRFAISFGEHCYTGSGSPFANIKLIEEIYPEGRRIPPYVSPVVKFGLPMDEEIVIPVTADDGTIMTKRYRPYLVEDAFGVVGSQASSGEIVWNDRKTKATFRLDQPLDQRTDYEVQAAVRVKEVLWPVGEEDYMLDGQIYEEDSLSRFRTGRMPYPMDKQQILYCRPFQNQRYFLQGENLYSQGEIHFIQDYKNPYFPDTDEEGNDYEYFIRFTALDGSDTSVVALDLSGSRIQSIGYNMPALVNDQIYAVQLIRKKDPTALDMMLANMNNNSSLSVRTFRTENTEQDLFSEYRIRSEDPINPADILYAGEELIYAYFFKTSRYNTLEEKMADAELIAETATWGAVALQVENEEGFDRFDIYGKNYRDGGHIAPRITITDNFESAYHTEKAIPAVRPLLLEYTERMASDPVLCTVGSLSKRYSDIRALIMPQLQIDWFDDQISLNLNEHISDGVETALTRAEILSSLGSNQGLTSFVGSLDQSGGRETSISLRDGLRIYYPTNMMVGEDADRIIDWASTILSGVEMINLTASQLPCSYGNYFNTQFPSFIRKYDYLVDNYWDLYDLTTSAFNGSSPRETTSVYQSGRTSGMTPPVKIHWYGNRQFAQTADKSGTSLITTFNSN